MNSRMAVRWAKGTSFRIMIGCLAGFCSSRFLKERVECEQDIRQ